MIQTDRRERLIGWYRQALRFVIPAECLGCDRSLGTDPIPLFCRRCWESITPMAGASCCRCGQPFVSSAAVSWSPDHQCQGCLERPPAYRRAWTLFPYLPPLQDAICSFKYRGKVALAKPLASLMISALPVEIDVDLLMPVPLHPARLRGREFNQSLLLADQLGRHLLKPVSATHLVRVLATDPQTTLSRHERLRNLRQAFEVRNPEAIVGRRILLVDDVFTTGTTLNECAKTLLKAEAASVCALTLARTIDTSLVPDRLLARQAARFCSAPEM
ncbi:MAG TPA: ComF family protein [Nitrospira sp.]|nr:ComF family protein [Nitrospira sp.]